MRSVRQGTAAYLRFCQKRGGVCPKENKIFLYQCHRNKKINTT